MRKKTLLGSTAFLLTFASLLLTGTLAAAQTETVLHNFGRGKDGTQVNGGLAFDAAGNLYGSATGGGYYCCYQDGMVFELSPQTGGGWAETPIYSFGLPSGGYLPNGTDRAHP